MKWLNKHVKFGNVQLRTILIARYVGGMQAKGSELENVQEVFDELYAHVIVSMECFRCWICSKIIL